MVHVTVGLPHVAKVSNAAQSGVLKPARSSGPPSVHSMLKQNTCRHLPPFAQQPYVLVVEI